MLRISRPELNADTERRPDGSGLAVTAKIWFAAAGVATVCGQHLESVRLVLIKATQVLGSVSPNALDRAAV